MKRVVWFLACCLFSCSPKQTVELPIKPSPPPNLRLSEEEQAISESLPALEKGLKSLIRGDHSFAITQFDLALLPVLDCLNGLEEPTELAFYFRDLLVFIHEHESENTAPSPDSELYTSAALEKLLDPKLLDFDDGKPLVIALPMEPPTAYDYPVVAHATVDRYLASFMTEKAHIIGPGLERSTRYLPMIRGILRETGVPVDLSYLPLIESAYKIRALSRASALGLWQFIKGTGRLYDLKINWWLDERQDPEAATRAAATHLKDLFNEFGDWNLVLSAYNAGPGRVRRAIRRGGTRNYWELCERKLLPRETRAYAPAFMAGLRIAKNPGLYGFANLSYESPVRVAQVTVPFGLELSVLEEALGLTENALVELNPALRHGATPPNQSTKVYVPQEMVPKARAKLREVPVAQRLRQHRYQVERGDSLGQIARNYGTTVRALMKANRIKDARKLRIGQMLRIPVGGVPLIKPKNQVAQAEPLPIKRVTYQLKQGDTLYLLSKRFQTTIPSILNLNAGLGPVELPFGREIVIKQGDMQVRPMPVRRKGYTYYRVRKGDTVSQIAKRHQIAMAHLLKYNGLKANTLIRPGQKLKIPNRKDPASQVRIHVVRQGETLFKIADQYRTTVSKLLEWNQLKSESLIIVGQKLLVYK